LLCYFGIVSKENVPKIIALEVARLLRTERVRQELSMTRLAEKSGLSQPMVSYVERGMRNPTLDTLLRIAIALDVDLWMLLKQASQEH
jgi:transcriptional regulator with XRE-family HTH domain